MDSREEALALSGSGLEGNANQGGKRQVTVIERKVFDHLTAELGRRIEPVWRRANIMVSGLSLKESQGRILRLGALRLDILGETRPCERMDEACPGLQSALRPEWRGGVYGVVLNDATVCVGDPATWESPLREK